MNAQLEFLRAKASPLPLSTAIALALAFSATAQAQYRYPGSGSSSGHSAYLRPIQAGARNRPVNSRQAAPNHGSGSQMPPGTLYRRGPQGDQNVGPSGSGYGASASEYRQTQHVANGVHPIEAGQNRAVYSSQGSPAGNGNPSMRPGEACPPGSRCATAPARGGGSGAGQSSSGYGHGYSYGNTPPHSASITPVRAGGERVVNASSAASNAAHQKLGSGPMRSSKEFTDGQTNSLPSFTTGTSPNPLTPGTGGAGIPGVNKQTHKSSTVISGSVGEGFSGRNHEPGVPNVTSKNFTPNITSPGQTNPTNSPTGSTYATVAGGHGPTGGLGGASGGGPHQGVGSHGKNSINGGTAGASDTWSEDNQKYNPLSGDGTTTSDYGSLTWKDHKPSNGTDSSGQTWVNGKAGKLRGFGSGSTQNEEDKAAGRGLHTLMTGTIDISKQPVKSGTGSSDTGDMGPDYSKPVAGSVEKLHTPHGGTDVGAGHPGAAPTGGGTDVNNANGFVTAPSGQDTQAKPREKGVLKVDYNGKRGAIDPKLKGGNGGG